MNTNDYSNLAATRLSDRIDDRLETIAAIGDALGSMAFEDVHDDTPRRLGLMIYRMANEANGLAAELWRRHHAAKVRLGDYPGESPPTQNESAASGTSTDGAEARAKDADKFADGERCHDEV